LTLIEGRPTIARIGGALDQRLKLNTLAE